MKKNQSLLFLTALVLSLVSCKETPSSVTDIDGNVYPAVQIGTQVWMAANLKTNRYRNGAIIRHLRHAGSWWNNMYIDSPGAWASYDNDYSNDVVYGKLYNWYAVSNSQMLCPTGWRVPSNADWAVLNDFLAVDAAFKIRSTVGWKDNANGSNQSSFNALPSGYRTEGLYVLNYYDLHRDFTFKDEGIGAYFWSSTEYGDEGNAAWGWSLSLDHPDIKNGLYEARYGLSVRCIKD